MAAYAYSTTAHPPRNHEPLWSVFGGANPTVAAPARRKATADAEARRAYARDRKRAQRARARAEAERPTDDQRIQAALQEAAQARAIADARRREEDAAAVARTARIKAKNAAQVEQRLAWERRVSQIVAMTPAERMEQDVLLPTDALAYLQHNPSGDFQADYNTGIDLARRVLAQPSYEMSQKCLSGIVQGLVIVGRYSGIEAGFFQTFQTGLSFRLSA